MEPHHGCGSRQGRLQVRPALARWPHNAHRDHRNRAGHGFRRPGLCGGIACSGRYAGRLFAPSVHRALETAEIAGVRTQYREAALHAKKAGFDGVEIMAANGHLIDQFLQDNSNKRTDPYGGPIANRARLLLEVVETVADVWRAERVGVRLAPSGTYNGMGDSHSRGLFHHVADSLNRFGLAYLHLIEPRVKGGETIAEAEAPVAAQELSKVFRGPVIAAGGFSPETAERSIADGDAGLIAFGRHFIANPD
jgi:N-ethylmaleimide reductase